MSWASKILNQVSGFLSKISFKISQFPPGVKQEIPSAKIKNNPGKIVPRFIIGLEHLKSAGLKKGDLHAERAQENTRAVFEPPLSILLGSEEKGGWQEGRFSF